MYGFTNSCLKNNVKSPIAEAVVIATMTDIRGYHGSWFTRRLYCPP